MNHDQDDKAPIALSLADVKTLAMAVAAEMKALGNGAMPASLRDRFINVRAALFQRGIYDPVLVRFDSATASPASPAEVAEELQTVAEGLTGA
jgi:hypothetical protein